jgi:acetyl-CoA carboxylase biotin carboxyl carrier protein
MNFDEIKQLLDMVREHELSEFELERQDFKLRVRKNTSGQWTATMPPISHVNYAPVMAPPLAAPPAAAAPPALTPAQEDTDFAVVKSPIVGTFYRAPEPGAKPFAEVGDMVKKGQVLCIIEAMKLMNEINSDVDGEVVKVYVENGQPVQYGERLFAIRPA